MAAKFVKFLETRPRNSKVIIVSRGIDGSSIDPGSWLYLQRYPLDITLTFTVAEIFVQMRAEGLDYFSRTPVYDQRLYGCFSLSVLTDQIRSVSHDAKSAWLLSEWYLGRQHRIGISIAYQTGDPVAIGIAQAAFRELYTSGRNGVPVMPLQLIN
jgi:hypothetical protein